MKVLKVVTAVIAFFLAQKTVIEGFVTDAEKAFPGEDAGLGKLQYVLGRVFTYAEQIDADITDLPTDVVTAVLSGHISQVVAKLFPPAPAVAIAKT